MTTIVIQCDLTQEQAEAACEKLSDMLNADVFLGLEAVSGWKIPTDEDWG